MDAHELLAASQRAHLSLQEAVERLLELERGRHLPAARRTLSLTAALPKARDDRGGSAASYGVLNPNPVVLYLGVGGDPAEPNRGAIAVPANALLVLPLSVDDVELGVDPADPNLAGGASATVHVLRFATVQPAFLGAV
jgi:hypothetical protein